MAISKFLLVTMVLISLFVFCLVEADDDGGDGDNQVVYTAGPEGANNPTYIPTSECGTACEARCSLASRHKMCLRACGTCCTRCNCVPPGTSGNQDLCPCYRDMLTHHGKHKCP
ncbi:gibberellin-regulated protein 1-like [Solanum tuberosum]|uniref:GAST n=1 Tax=Solanum tuberosum TaxID=4113 RepID=M1CV60_SOLTU|nr:PREDICTED: gibberellin-regulated protein 1-like [Solanum tuberosum]